MLGTRAGNWYVLCLLRHHNLRGDYARQAVMMIQRYLKTMRRFSVRRDQGSDLVLCITKVEGSGSDAHYKT